ncbi:hypothetical protein EDC96DRAFT_542948 [Choanephora cucurbitarum]|nr:hypothetical protein EDC96DRAFT_542948 [Choanephora cucurbitarum]
MNLYLYSFLKTISSASADIYQPLPKQTVCHAQLRHDHSQQMGIQGSRCMEATGIGLRSVILIGNANCCVAGIIILFSSTTIAQVLFDPGANTHASAINRHTQLLLE